MYRRSGTIRGMLLLPAILALASIGIGGLIFLICLVSEDLDLLVPAMIGLGLVVAGIYLLNVEL